MRKEIVRQWTEGGTSLGRSIDAEYTFVWIVPAFTFPAAAASGDQAVKGTKWTVKHKVEWLSFSDISSKLAFLDEH